MLTISSLSVFAKNADFDKSFAALTERYNGSWTDVRVPVELKLNSPTKVSVSGTATIVKDESIFLSLRFLGFEVVQLKITRDSLFAVDKFNKRYVAEDIKDILHGIDLTVGNVQHILLGQPFVAGNDVFGCNDFKRFSFSPAGDNLPEMWVMSSTVSAGVNDAECSWVIDGFENPSLVGMLVSVPEIEREAMIYYKGIVPTSAGMVAGEISVSSQWGSRDISAEINWNLSKAKWNSGQSVDIRIPKGAQRISGSQLLRALEKL